MTKKFFISGIFFIMFFPLFCVQCFSQNIHYCIQFKPVDVIPTDYELGTVEKIFEARLSSCGYKNNSVYTKNNKIFVEFTADLDEQTEDDLINLLCSKSELKFLDANGNTLLTNSDIKTAKALNGTVSQNGMPEPYVELTFKKESVAKFAEATKNAAAAPYGKNYITIMIDNAIISAPRVNEEINSDTCVISGNFTPESAQELANQINSGTMPYEMEPEAISKTETNTQSSSPFIKFFYNLRKTIKNFLYGSLLTNLYF